MPFKLLLSRLVIAALMLVTLTVPASADYVSAIIDGSTFIVAGGSHTGQVKLLGVNAPGITQPRGVDAYVYLTSLLLYRDVQLRCDYRMMEYNGVRVCQAFVNGQNVQQLMVQNGYATYDNPYYFQNQQVVTVNRY